MGKLTAKDLKSLNTPGRYGDGDGLMFQVQGPQQKSWLYRYMRQGKQREMGLGAFPQVSLADARRLRDKARIQRHDGVDPIQARRAARAATSAPTGITFRDAAERYIADRKGAWTNPKHAEQWRNTLTTYAYPFIGDKGCREITVADVETLLRPIWGTKTETAHRVRGRIEKVIGAAHAREAWEPFRNPAVWRGTLEHLFDARRKMSPVQHFKALPWTTAPAFMVRLRNDAAGMGAFALEWTILTAARSLMTRAATWAEIDEEARVWTVPRTRIVAAETEDGDPVKVGSGLKQAPEHRIPITEPLLRLLDLLREFRKPDQGDYLFPGTKRGKPISNATMSMVLKRLAVPVTVHGFRSTFRDWAAEATRHQSEVAEVALTHALPGGATRAAYQRGDLFDKRRELMNDWARYLDDSKIDEALQQRPLTRGEVQPS